MRRRGVIVDKDTPRPPRSALSLHDALPISTRRNGRGRGFRQGRGGPLQEDVAGWRVAARRRSEEHTSELQSPVRLVCRLLLEKKKALRLLADSFAAVCTLVFNSLRLHLDKV